MPGDDEIESVNLCVLTERRVERSRSTAAAVPDVQHACRRAVHVEVATDKDRALVRRQLVENCRQLFEKCHCQCLTARSVDAE